MVNVAIVEDSNSAANALTTILSRYQQENDVEFGVFRFENAISFLTGYKANYDIVLMDIDLPDIDGMTAAHRLREMDKRVLLIFVTNMAQLAVKGYEVEAYDFVVKPVSYANFALKLHRALNKVNAERSKQVLLSVDDGTVAFNIKDIKYVEVIRHRIIYHTTSGEYNAHGTLKEVERQLDDSNFVRCNSCYLVNLRAVTSVKGYTVYVGDEPLQISHPKRSEFLRALNDFFGGEV